MRLRAAGGVAVLCMLMTACHGQTDGEPASSAATATSLAGVSPPTTAAPNKNVTGATFDGCASVTDAEAASWGADPAKKHDDADGRTAQWEIVRGCYWFGPKWQLRVDARDGSLANFDHPDPKFEHKEQVQIGSRQAWVARDAAPHAGCMVFIPSQQGIVTVQLVGGIDVQDARTDLCPQAIEIMKALEPRIP